MLKTEILLVGNFPPPVHGAAVVNESVLRLLRQRGVEPIVLNTSAVSLSRAPSVRIRRLRKVLRAAATVARGRSGQRRVVYIGMSGGYGQLSDLIVLLAARFVGARAIAHHHSYAYLGKRQARTAACIRAMGASGTHVVLCNDMKRRLQETYPEARDVAVVSNAGFATTTANPTIREQLRVVGFFSNVSEAKGILYFLDTMALLAQRAPTIRGVIGGAFENAEIEQNVKQKVAALPNVEYAGPKYGDDKTRFLAGIDVLLFPSIYRNEAEPVTILEASAAGIPVIASARGCISELVSSNGRIIRDMNEFAETAARQIMTWADNQSEFRELSAAAIAAYDTRKSAHAEALDALFETIVGDVDR